MATQTTNIVEATREQFRNRLDELQPFLNEAEQIKQTLAFMEQSTGASTGGTSRRRGRRPKGEPTRKDEFLTIVKDTPGVTVTEIAEKMGLGNQKNYLYRIAAELADEGLVKKDGRTYNATDQVPTAPDEADAEQEREDEPVPA